MRKKSNYKSGVINHQKLAIENDKELKKDISMMRYQLYTVRKRCKSCIPSESIVNGKKVYRVLSSIRERNERVRYIMRDGRSVSPVIGYTDEPLMKKIYKNVHKNLDQMKGGPDRRRSSFISGKKISSKIDHIIDKVKRSNSANVSMDEV